MGRCRRRRLSSGIPAEDRRVANRPCDNDGTVAPPFVPDAAATRSSSKNSGKVDHLRGLKENVTMGIGPADGGIENA